MLDVSSLPIFDDNYVWIIHSPEKRDEVCVIDPGDGHAVIHFLEDRGFKLQKILITHSHNDHIGGINRLLEHAKVPVFGPDCDAIPQVTETIAGGDTFSLWGTDVKVLHTPGHLPEHLTYVIEHAGGTQIFSGDVLFSSGCGRIFRGTHEELKNSLDCIASYPEESIIYPTHEYTMANLHFAREVEPGNNDLRRRAVEVAELRADHQPTLPTTVGLEKKVNPFLRCTQSGVKDAAAVQLGREPIDELEVFTSLRAWKDMF